MFPVKYYLGVKIILYTCVVLEVQPWVCTENTYITKGRVERWIQQEVKPSVIFTLRHIPSVVFFVHMSSSGALRGTYVCILYFELCTTELRILHIVYTASDNTGPVVNWKWSGHNQNTHRHRTDWRKKRQANECTHEMLLYYCIHQN